MLTLQELGFNADTVIDGLEVLYAIALQRYDVILMNMQIPTIDGLETTRTIRQDYPQTDQPYIIALLPSEHEVDQAAYYKAGVNDCVTKPLTVEILHQALEKV